MHNSNHDRHTRVCTRPRGCRRASDSTARCYKRGAPSPGTVSTALVRKTSLIKSSSMAPTSSPTSFLIATISCILIICSKLSVLAMPTPNMMMAGTSQIVIPQAFYSGLNVLSRISVSCRNKCFIHYMYCITRIGDLYHFVFVQITTARLDFSPLSGPNRRNYTSAVHSICELASQRDEVQQHVEITNSSAETIVIQAIVDGVLNNTCQWVSSC